MSNNRLDMILITNPNRLEIKTSQENNKVTIYQVRINISKINYMKRINL
jgi:hypothetical protein